MEEKKKTIIKTILITIFTIFLVCAIVLTISIFCFTENLAKICNDCGFHNISSNLYAYEYSKSKDINYIYRSCQIDISNNYFENYIKHFNEFVKDESYDELVEQINNINYHNSDLSILVKSRLINEDAYFKNFYIKSLLQTNNIADAKIFVKNILNEYNFENITYLELEEYFVSQLIYHPSFDYNFFNELLDSNKSIISMLIDIYQNNINHYNEIVESIDVDDIYFLSFCMQILQLGSDIQQINSKINIVNTNIINNIIDNEVKINNTINVILEKNNE